MFLIVVNMFLMFFFWGKIYSFDNLQKWKPQL
jgi:hypothetical protein